MLIYHGSYIIPRSHFSMEVFVHILCLLSFLYFSREFLLKEILFCDQGITWLYTFNGWERISVFNLWGKSQISILGGGIFCRKMNVNGLGSRSYNCYVIEYLVRLAIYSKLLSTPEYIKHGALWFPKALWLFGARHEIVINTNNEQ